MPNPHTPLRLQLAQRASMGAAVEGGLTLSPAASPGRAHTVGALFREQALGRLRVKGEESDSFDRLYVKV